MAKGIVHEAITQPSERRLDSRLLLAYYLQIMQSYMQCNVVSKMI